MSICLWAQKQPMTCRETGRWVDECVYVCWGGWRWIRMSAFYSLQKRIIQVQRPLVFHNGILFCPVSPVGLGPPDGWISLFKWQGRPREMPTGPAVPGFQRPGDPVAVDCQRGDESVWWRDNLCRTEPRAVCLSDRLINGNPPRKKPLSAKGSREKKPSLITGTPGIKAWPSLIN